MIRLSRQPRRLSRARSFDAAGYLALALLDVVLLLLLVLVGARLAFGQPGVQVPVVVTSPARDTLEAAWRTETVNVDATERGWCVTSWRILGDSLGHRILFVEAVERAAMVEATAYLAAFRCGGRAIALHTHMPTTCSDATGREVCEHGGGDAWQCAPSMQDRVDAQRSNVIGILQCDEHAFIAYGGFVSLARPDGASTPARPPSSLTSGTRAQLYASVLALGVVANATWHLDRDAGGYSDSWTNRAAFPKKIVHGLVGYGLTAAALDAGVPARYAVPLTCGAAIGFEETQGFVSWRDALAGCAGGAVAALWRRLVR